MNHVIIEKNERSCGAERMWSQERFGMSKKLFGSGIEPKCEYCTECVLTADKKTALCKRKGFTTPDGSCRKFEYDPLKRTPRAKQPPLPEFTDEDFSLLLEDEE